MVNAPLARITEPTYALMRIVVGGLFAFHGAQKLLGAFGGQPVPLSSMMGLAGGIELIGGILVMIGLVAGIAAFLASGQMAVAYFTAHFPKAFWPIENQGELAAVYCFVFLFIAAKGAGIWSVDSAMSRSWSRPADYRAPGTTGPVSHRA